MSGELLKDGLYDGEGGLKRFEMKYCLILLHLLVACIIEIE